MATTSQLLTWLELELHGWNREGPRGTRAMLNEAQKILLQQECEQNLLFDPFTGDFPFLTTVAGQYVYNVPALVGVLNYWLIRAVVVDPANAPSGQYWQFEDYYFGKNLYYRIKNMRTLEAGASPLLVASVAFIKEDPGDTTDVFRIAGYREPVAILSDAIQHEMPGSTDIEFLYPAAIMLIRSINDDKKMEESRKYIEMVLKPRVIQSLDRGEHGNSDFVIKRAF